MSNYSEEASRLLEAEMGEVPSSLRQYASLVVAASTQELATSSSANYLRSWRRFLSFCHEHNLHPLPPKITTINMYFAYLCSNFSFNSVLAARAAIKHFFSLRFPGEPSPTDFGSVTRCVRGLERKFKKPVMKKNGLSAEVLNKLISILLPDGVENCSLLNLRNAAFFSLLYFASARFSDIVACNICYVRYFSNPIPHAVVGFNRLKNQKNDCDVGLAYISENVAEEFSCYKLVQALSRRLLVTGLPEDLLFPAMAGNRLLKKPVSYAAMAKVFKKTISQCNLDSHDISNLGLHSFRIGAITAGVNSGKLTSNQLQRAGRWSSPAMIEHYTRHSIDSNLLFSQSIG